MQRIGVFLCTGCGIGEALDIAALEKAARAEKAAHSLTHPCLCSPEGVASIRAAIADGTVDGVLVAACSSRAKVQEFSFDPMKVAVERVPLREQVVWCQPPHHEDTQLLADDLLRMGIAKLARMALPSPFTAEISDTVLVVGGGLAGLEAARAAAGAGHPVVLVERATQLGGRMAAIAQVLPQQPPYDVLHPNRLHELVAQIQGDSRIEVHTGARITSIAGQPGQFAVTLATGEGEKTFTAGAIVQATGAVPYDARKLPHLGYGASPNVVTSEELDSMLAREVLEKPGGGGAPQRVLFVQCAGSRDPQHLPYCSAECCGTTLRQVAAIHQLQPDVETTVVYRDMRMPGQLERFYLAVQSQANTLLTRGEVVGVHGNGHGPLQVRLGNSLLGDDVTLAADLVVLAVGMVPNAADGEALRALRDAQIRAEKGESESQRREAAALAAQLAHHQGTEILNLEYRQGPDLPVLKYGFPDSHFICFPYETRRTGIYAAGTVRAPMDPAQAAEDGWGAAMKAIQCIVAAKRGAAVHPRAGDLGMPDFFLQRCTQCKRCTEECPFGTLNEDLKGTPLVHPLRCRRCGICMGACPERIISFPDYGVDRISAMIKAMSVPEEFEEKPRILALVCENDALPALDQAAARRLHWSPWIRVIPLRCLGSMNIVWIADALSRGIDGVLLIGCKSGDEYQCHYVRGSQLAQTRLGNVQETLTRLALEPARIKVVELSHHEFPRIPEIFNSFAAEIEALGANPMKGF